MKNDIGLRYWPTDVDHSFMGRWYPEPFEFMPCRTVLRNTRRRGDDTSVAANGCAMHVAHACLRRRPPTNTLGLLHAWGPGTCVSALRVQRRVHSTHVYLTRTHITSCTLMLHHHFYRISFGRPRLAAAVRLTAEK